MARAPKRVKLYTDPMNYHADAKACPVGCILSRDLPDFPYEVIGIILEYLPKKGADWPREKKFFEDMLRWTRKPGFYRLHGTKLQQATQDACTLHHIKDAYRSLQTADPVACAVVARIAFALRDRLVTSWARGGKDCCSIAMRFIKAQNGYVVPDQQWPSSAAGNVQWLNCAVRLPLSRNDLLINHGEFERVCRDVSQLMGQSFYRRRIYGHYDLERVWSWIQDRLINCIHWLEPIPPAVHAMLANLRCFLIE